ncbi:MAG: Gfo/Idh/MocA family oxidoreductase [Cyclobacteriaceae bacterium]
MKLTLLILSLSLMLILNNQAQPLKIGVVGLTHTHVHWLLGRPDRGDVEIVGIAEPNKDLADRYIAQHGLNPDLWYPTMEEMVKATQPEAVTAFGSIYEHLEVVEYCAPKGIHVMVEKPLAVSNEHALKMKALAEEHNILLLTNYETTWYSTHFWAKDEIDKGKVGELRKLVIHDGHPGPKEIGVNDEFLEWLTDPVQNGAGALTDFGCYGANLATWLMKGERPLSVMALTQQIKPDIYPNVDDEATILLEYPKAQVIIQASWNWPISRKDMEVYGASGQILVHNRNELTYQYAEGEEPTTLTLEEREAPLDDPFGYMAAVIRGNIEAESYDLSSLENNMLVVEILEAAKESAKKGQRIKL